MQAQRLSRITTCGTGNSLVTDQIFTGQKLDGTGLQYYNSRYYDPAVGVFVSPDSIVPDATGVFDYNRFMFVVGNPLKFNDPTGHIYDPSDATGGMIGPVNWAGAARSTIQLSVDVATKAASTAIVAEGFRESVPLQQPKVDVVGVPLEGQTPQVAWPTSFEALGQQVLADPLPTVEMGSNVVYSALNWKGENTTIVGEKSSGRLAGYTEGTSDLTGGLSSAEKLFQTMTGRVLQTGDSNSLAPTDIFIDPGKLEIRFRPTSSSGTPVMEIVNHATKTFEKIHFNQ